MWNAQKWTSRIYCNQLKVVVLMSNRKVIDEYASKEPMNKQTNPEYSRIFLNSIS
jgi:hypothetical protein